MDWLKETFSESDWSNHLKKAMEEIDEVAAAIDNYHGPVLEADEYADVIICLLASAADRKISAFHLFEAVWRKMEINKRRKWERKEDGTYQHVNPPLDGKTKHEQ